MSALSLEGLNALVRADTERELYRGLNVLEREFMKMLLRGSDPLFFAGLPNLIECWKCIARDCAAKAEERANGREL